MSIFQIHFQKISLKLMCNVILPLLAIQSHIPCFIIDNFLTTWQFLVAIRPKSYEIETKTSKYIYRSFRRS